MDIADAMVLIVGWKLIGIIERVIWDGREAERSKQSMKAFRGCCPQANLRFLVLREESC